MDRPPIPRQLEREVLLEAGHRCAMPTCHQTPVEIAHIVPWEKVQEHTFDNLIALCPTCHARYDRGEIDRKSMLQYKANLSILSGRYCDLEQRVLRVFSQNPGVTRIWLPGGLYMLLMNLLDDGMILKLRQVTNGVVPHSVWVGAAFTFCSMRIGGMEDRSNLPVIVTNPSRGRYCGVSIPRRSLLNVTGALDQGDSSWNLLLAELSTLSKIAEQSANDNNHESSGTVAPEPGKK